MHIRMHGSLGYHKRIYACVVCVSLKGLKCYLSDGGSEVYTEGLLNSE